jgi:hypothetical protein
MRVWYFFSWLVQIDWNHVLCQFTKSTHWFCVSHRLSVLRKFVSLLEECLVTFRVHCIWTFSPQLIYENTGHNNVIVKLSNVAWKNPTSFDFIREDMFYEADYWQIIWCYMGFKSFDHKLCDFIEFKNDTYKYHWVECYLTCVIPIGISLVYFTFLVLVSY